MTFQEWMNQVNQEVSAIAFVSVLDLPDYMFRDAFDAGCDPAEVAIEVLENAGFPAELLF